MKIITLNVNGIRSAVKKGFFDWVIRQDADVICVQELKAQENDLREMIFHPAGYHAYFHYAEKKGYSGVGIYSRHQPKNVVTGLGFDLADQEGRYVAIELEKMWVASLYMPSGTSGDDRQAMKFHFLERYGNYLQQQNKADEFVICGDWNIAHKEIDLKNWRSNQKNSGFLPEERAWMDRLFNEWGFVDAFRVINQGADHYTWWSNRGRAREKNVGWRIDYQVITSGLKARVRSADIYTDEKFSDHAPLILEYDI